MVRGHEKMEERTYEEWMGCQTDGQTDGRTEGRNNEHRDGQLHKRTEPWVAV